MSKSIKKHWKTSEKKFLAKELTTFCDLLNKEYNINYGGCCYVTYCICKLLTKANIKYKIVVSNYEHLPKYFNDIPEACCHYFIEIDHYTINRRSNDYRSNYNIKRYCNVKPRDILRHYNINDWNEEFDVDSKNTVANLLTVFFYDLCERWEYLYYPY